MFAGYAWKSDAQLMQQSCNAPQLVCVFIFANSSFTIAKSIIGTENIVAGESETQDIIFSGIGRKQIGYSSLAGGSLKRASRVSRQHVAYMLVCASANDSSGNRHCSN
jgi:hypothetical protein